MRGLIRAFLLLAVSAAVVRGDLTQEAQQGRGHAGDQGGFQIQSPHGQHEQADAEVKELVPSSHKAKIKTTGHAGKQDYDEADAAAIRARVDKVLQAQKAENEAAALGHADKVAQVRHSQAVKAADAEGIVSEKVQAKAAEGSTHAQKAAHSHHTAAEAREGKPSPHLTSNHGKAEAIYWDARGKIDALRKSFPPATFKTKFSNITDIVRVWDFYSPDYNCPLLKERVGRIGDGGKWVCGMRMLQEMKHCLVYSLGSQGDTSFEDEFLDRTICDVHTFDPFLADNTEEAVKGRPGLQFHPVGILGSADGRVGTNSPERWQSLESMMAELGHEWLEVLKIDIEGSEWGLFSDFYKNPGATLPATNLMVEFHMPNDAAEVLSVLDMIQADGFRVFSAEPNYYCLDGACAALMTEIAFVKVSPEGLVCIPHGHATTGEGALAQLPAGCLNPPNRGLMPQ